MTNSTETTTRTYRRGEYAILKAWEIRDYQRVQIVRAENLTVGLAGSIEYPERQERWYVVRLPEGGTIMVHPSSLIECID